jgi:protein-S-isoprenylcysteine O-methyltransferase Ste14
MNNFTENMFLINKDGIRNILREFILIFFRAGILFFSAGTINWINGWVYFFANVLFQALLTIVLMIKNPRLLNERGKVIRKETNVYDVYFVITYIIFSIVCLITAGFDAVRYQWTALSFCFVYPGLVICLVGSIIGMQAMAVNPFFSVTQRIQTEADHRVINIGPYKYLRHPGYLSWIISALSYPFITGSIISFIPISVMIIVFIIRTYLEDKTLQKELNGYMEYTLITRYRLIPYVW